MGHVDLLGRSFDGALVVVVVVGLLIASLLAADPGHGSGNGSGGDGGATTNATAEGGSTGPVEIVVFVAGAVVALGLRGRLPNLAVVVAALVLVAALAPLVATAHPRHTPTVHSEGDTDTPTPGGGSSSGVGSGDGTNGTAGAGAAGVPAFGIAALLAAGAAFALLVVRRRR